MILITGAAGKTGRAVLRALRPSGQTVRAFVRRPEQAEPLNQLGVADVVAGDLLDETALARAFQGIKAVYHIPPNVHPQEVEIGELVIRAAQRAGVGRFVYHSVLHPQIEAMPHHWKKMRVEEKLFESGLPFTILQPCAYMQNILAGWAQIAEKGVYAVPYRVEARLSLVDLEDVAAAAAIVLTEPGHTGAAYELAGPDFISQVEVARTLAEVLGRSVAARQTPIEDWRQDAGKSGLSAYAVDTLVKMFAYYDRYDFQGNPTVLKTLLGRAPTGLESFLQNLVLSA